MSESSTHYNTILTISDWDDAGKQLVLKVKNTETGEEKIFKLNIHGTDWSAKTVDGNESFDESTEKLKKIGYGWVASCLSKGKFEDSEKTFSHLDDRLNQYEKKEEIDRFFKKIN